MSRVWSVTSTAVDGSHVVHMVQDRGAIAVSDNEGYLGGGNAEKVSRCCHWNEY